MVDILVSWIARAIAEALEGFVNLVMPIFGFSFDSFAATFPWARTGYYIFQYVAMVLVLIISAAYLLMFIFPGRGQLNGSPFRQAFNAFFAIAMIYYGNYILEVIISLSAYPFTAVLSTDASAGTMNPLEFNISPAIASVNDIFFAVSIPLYILMLCLIGWSFIKLILEAIERYVVLFVLVYTAPLAFACMASESTSGIFKKFFSMFLSQCVMLLLSIWSVKMGISMLSNLGGTASPILGFLMGYAFLRIALKLDSYLNQIGLNAAITGAGLGTELLATGVLLSSRLGGLFGGGLSSPGGSGGPSGSSGGGFGGFTAKVVSAYGKYSPLAGATEHVKNTVGAFAKTAFAAAKEGNSAFGPGGVIGAVTKSVKEGLSSVTGNRLTNTAWAPPKESPFSAAANAAREYWDQNIQSNLHNADMDTRESNLWTRADAAEYIDDVAGKFSGRYSAPVTQEEMEDISQYSHMADAAYQDVVSQGTTITDSESVAAVMQGLGVSGVDAKAAEFLDPSSVERSDYVMDSAGIHASYTKDGRIETMDIVSDTQYKKLSSGEQQNYQGFRSGAGQQYYYRRTSARAPSESQMRETSFQDVAIKFAQAPQDHPLTMQDVAYMKRSPEAVNTLFDNLHITGSQVKDSQQIATTLEAMRIPGVNSGEKNEAVMKMLSGNVDFCSMDGNGLQVSWHSDTGEAKQITVLTKQGASRYDAEYLENRQYHFHNNAGSPYYSLFERNGETDN
ncbi:MAG TPA: hypothetical protein IAC31_02165 [Candidatus Faecousia intestinigallinarum]|nr:hypothetical protein [Candidatus Faecousia intestinigallinarum]